jgi:signal peptidase I
MPAKLKRPRKVKIAVFLLFIILVVFCVYCFLSFQIIHVDGESMQPTIMKGNYVLVNCYSYFFREPKKGDIVLIKRKTKDPSDHINLSIKRITGIPGDEVEYQNANDSSKTETVYLSEGEYFMVGDNAGDSYDSRHYGAVKDSTIIGKVIFIK